MMADDTKEVAVEIPHDVLNEQVVIASALVDETARKHLVMKVAPEQFVDPQHKAIWTAVLGLNRNGIAFSLPTLLTKVSGAVDINYIRQLNKQHPSAPVDLTSHVTQLQWDSARVQASNGPLQDLLKALRDPTSTPATVRAHAAGVAKSFNIKLDRQFMESPVALADKAIDELVQRQQMAVYPFGLPAVDMDDQGKHRIVPGVAPKKTTLITGVSGSAKSVLAGYIVLEQAMRQRHVLYGAWEMGSVETLTMLAAMHCGFSRYDLETGQLGALQLKQLRQSMEMIGQYVKFFDPPFSSDVKKKYDNDASLDVLAQQIYDSGCDVFVADLWERCIVDGRPEAERRALFRQQQIAKETGCHQILVCQQKLKEIESRKDKRPTRSTIIGSAAWVEVADTILGVHRPKLWDPEAEDTIEISILKQRFGIWPALIEHDWDGNMMTIENGRQIPFEDPSAADGADLFGGKR